MGLSPQWLRPIRTEFPDADQAAPHSTRTFWASCLDMHLVAVAYLRPLLYHKVTRRVQTHLGKHLDDSMGSWVGALHTVSQLCLFIWVCLLRSSFWLNLELGPSIILGLHKTVEIVRRDDEQSVGSIDIPTDIIREGQPSGCSSGSNWVLNNYRHKSIAQRGSWCYVRTQSLRCDF